MITSLDQLDLNKQYTYADYLTWNIGQKIELIKGKIFVDPPAQSTPSEKDVLASLYVEIKTGLKDQPILTYPATVTLKNKQTETAANNDIIVQPDISVFCDKGKFDYTSSPAIPGWIIEVLSPGNTKSEMKDKFALYQNNGVREYWIVYPLYLMIHVYDLINENLTLRQIYFDDDKIPVKAFDGFLIDASAIFKI